MANKLDNERKNRSFKADGPRRTDWNLTPDEKAQLHLSEDIIALIDSTKITSPERFREVMDLCQPSIQEKLLGCELHVLKEDAEKLVASIKSRQESGQIIEQSEEDEVKSITANIREKQSQITKLREERSARIKKGLTTSKSEQKTESSNEIQEESFQLE